MSNFPSLVSEIKEKLDIVDIISGKVVLKKSGKHYSGHCPFHSERSASFFVYSDTQSYYCFGCHETGDVFSFVMKERNIDFPEALEELARLANVDLPHKTSDGLAINFSTAQADPTEELYALNEAALAFFRSNLNTYPKYRDYLMKQRGLNHATIVAFGLGCIDEGGLQAHLAAQGYTDNQMVLAGFLAERKDGSGLYEQFRERVMFAIRDRKGRIIAFGGRIIEKRVMANGRDVAKYINSPQTPLFEKGTVLYGLDAAYKSISTSGEMVVVEGYLDVITAHQAEYTNVVAPMGTAISPKHLELVKKVAKTVVLALDGDAAGQRATLLSIQDLAAVTAIKIAVMPEGKDPDDIIKTDPIWWGKIIEESLPWMDFLITHIIGKYNIDTASGLRGIINEVGQKLAAITEPVEREHYIMKLSRKLNVPLDAVKAQLANTKINSRKKALVVEATEPKQQAEPEDYLLATLLRYPDTLEVQGADGLTVGLEDFGKVENKELFRLFRYSKALPIPAFALQGQLDFLQQLAESEPATTNYQLTYREYLDRARAESLRAEEGRLMSLVEEGSDKPEIWVRLNEISERLKQLYGG